MRFSIDAWDPSYGTSVDSDGQMEESTARLILDVEVIPAQWMALQADAHTRPPSAVLFVDGVRRIDARVWVADPVLPGAAVGGTASPGICASYAAGVVCCSGTTARLIAADVRRGMFAAATHATSIATSAGKYPLRLAASSDSADLSLALQRCLGEAELSAAVSARTSLELAGPSADDLLVVDGPLRGRTHLPRAIGLIKSHHAVYLPADLHHLVGGLAAAERTPVFHMGTSWERYAWYLRLPCPPAAPWAGVVRVECGADLAPADAIALANLSQRVLPTYASCEYKDRRAPQNLYPIAGLERELRRRLGDPSVLYRALRVAAGT